MGEREREREKDVDLHPVSETEIPTGKKKNDLLRSGIFFIFCKYLEKIKNKMNIEKK